MGDVKNDLQDPLDEAALPTMERVAEVMPGGFFVYHADGDESLIYSNKAMQRIFGCSTLDEFKRLTGYTFQGIVHPDDYERVEKAIEEQIAESVHNLDYVEYRIIQLDGTIRWVEDYGHFMHTKMYGDVFYVFIEDATERLEKRMSELEAINAELNNAYDREKQYKKAILHDAVTFFEVNLTKDEFITVATQVVNEECHDLFDVLEVEPFRKYSDFLKYCSQQVNQHELEAYWQFFNIEKLMELCRNGEYEVTREMQIVDSLGRNRYYRYTFLLGENNTTGDITALSVSKDITEEVERKKLLNMALSQAESASVAKRTFLSCMSHDIRTPLNGIIGYMDLMESHINEPEKLKGYLQKMKLSGAQLLSILTESMEYTRIESGKTTLVKSECNLLDLMVEVEKSVFLQAAAKQIHLRTDKSKLRHLEIVADAMRVKEILCQLLDNAIKYTPKQGEVTLSVLERNNAPAGHATYQFIVQDTGIGMKADFIEHMFEPFGRENNTTKSGIHGSGLGMAVVKSLIDMMEGSIQVQSEVGVGSTFTVVLTFALSKEQTQRIGGTVPSTEDKVDLTGKKILLVEDNEINMEIASELLTEQGMEVETAENGKIAVDKIKDNPPKTYDIILMDIQMPVMNGYEATKTIRAFDDPMLSQIPIIAVSTNAFAEDQEMSLKVGMNAHFPKPIDIGSLCSLISHVLSSDNVILHK